MHARCPPSRPSGRPRTHDPRVGAVLAVLTVIRSRWARREHRRLPSGTRLGCGRFSRSLSTPAGATAGASEQPPCRRSTDDRGIRVSRAVAQPGCCARPPGRRRGRRSARAVTVETSDAPDSRCQGTALGSEEAAHRRQATSSPTPRLNAEAALLDGRTLPTWWASTVD